MIYNGNPEANILLITEGLDYTEVSNNKPLSGMYQSLFQWLLNQANLSIRDVFVLPIFPLQIKRNDKTKAITTNRFEKLWSPKEGFSELGLENIYEFSASKVNFKKKHKTYCIVPMGELSFRLIHPDKTGVHKYRGSPLLLEDNINYSIPTYQPYQVSERGQYLLRYAVGSDLRKAKRFSKGYKVDKKELILP